MSAPAGFRDPDPARGLHVEIEQPAPGVERERLETVLRQAARDQQFEIEYLAVVLTDRETVHALNRDHLGHDYPTDVVSFPLEDDAIERRTINGEVYVDVDTARERAPEFGATVDTEILRYAVHGVLHLMGYDDSSEPERDEMRHLEDRYVNQY